MTDELRNTIREAAFKKIAEMNPDSDVVDIPITHEWPTYGIGIQPLAIAKSYHFVRMTKGTNGWEAGEVMTQHL